MFTALDLRAAVRGSVFTQSLLQQHNTSSSIATQLCKHAEHELMPHGVPAPPLLTGQYLATNSSGPEARLPPRHTGARSSGSATACHKQASALTLQLRSQISPTDFSITCGDDDTHLGLNRYLTPRVPAVGALLQHVSNGLELSNIPDSAPLDL